MSVHAILRSRLLAQAGLLNGTPRFSSADFAKLSDSEWSPEFERLMRNRMIMGALRYSTLAVKKVQRGKWDLVGSVKTKIKLYEATGNTEYLVDIANYCLLVFECDDHPKRHFHALDDHADHCKLK